MDKKQFNINKKYDLFYKLLLVRLFHRIINYNIKNKKVLNIHLDYEFIHIEFKNVKLLDNINKIQNYINDIKQIYYEALLQCSNELYPIRLAYDSTITYNNY